MSWHFTQAHPSKPITALANRTQLSTKIKPGKKAKRRPVQLELPFTPAGHAAFWYIPYRDRTRR